MSERKAGAGCPICDKPAAADYRPFCSKRCADVDLHRWLGSTYRIETEEQPEMPPEPDDRGGEG